MKKHLSKALISLISAGLLVTSVGCTEQGNKNEATTREEQNQGGQGGAGGTGGGTTAQGQNQNQGNGGMQNQDVTGGGPSAASAGDTKMLKVDEGVLPIQKIKGQSYVPAKGLCELLNFKSTWEPTTQALKFGDNDAAYEIRVGSTQARRDEETLKLNAAPILKDGTTYIPVAALGSLLADVLTFSERNGQVVFQPSPNMLNIGIDEDAAIPLSEELNFGEDPADPFKDADTPASAPYSTSVDSDDSVPVLKNINIPGLISRARTYLGVRYDFGAAPYPQSGRFDCSSYTQYLFGKYGITLPRTARAQALLGNRVSRTSLRRGDLMYFYVPGRFKTNKTVGHVGIYIGNNYMIHSSPEPKDGVQITSINKPYWKTTFLYAKRVAY